MGSPPPPTSSLKGSKPADRSKIYLITSPDSVSNFRTGEEVPRAYRMEVKSCALPDKPNDMIFWVIYPSDSVVAMAMSYRLALVLTSDPAYIRHVVLSYSVQ